MPHDIETKIQTGFQHWIAAPERKASPEVDYGLWWNLRGDAVAHPTDSRWRVSWLAATSELYAVELTPAPHLSLRAVQGRAGRVREGSRPDRYLLLGYFDDSPAVDAALAGWEQDDSPIYHNLSALATQLPEI
jgi:hypothetical protein